MKPYLRTGHPGVVLIALFLGMFARAENPNAKPTDELYLRIQQSVADADFDAMRATYHPDAILVTLDGTMPVSEVMPRWREAGEKLHRQGGSASVAFRFSRRQIDRTTGFEAGIFHYRSQAAGAPERNSYRHFENLTILTDAGWLTMMERQRQVATQAEWDSLEPGVSDQPASGP